MPSPIRLAERDIVGGVTPTDKSADGLDVVRQLRAVSTELDLLAAGFAQRNGLHPTDLRALVCLLDAARARTPVTPGSLGARLGLNSAGTTSLVDRLERLGHVRRTRDPRDRRRVLLEVDERAVALGEAYFGPLIAQVADAAAQLAEPELAAVRRFLASVLEGVTARREDG
ncbi:MarR family transcriptional regulator [Streptomyces diacarni]|uniref:MarR family transcriptional regulator n=1 Tax=Streptomyces diacarni TaxID=2800381 RepID=A0A367ESX6_9ACTN|nr:MarR family transcriptional regulator [Streptomyces diacarni]